MSPSSAAAALTQAVAAMQSLAGAAQSPFSMGGIVPSVHPGLRAFSAIHQQHQAAAAAAAAANLAAAAAAANNTKPVTDVTAGYKGLLAGSGSAGVLPHQQSITPIHQESIGTVNSARQSVDSPMTGSPAADPSHDSPALLFYPSPATSEQSGQTLNQQQSPPIVPSAPVTSQVVTPVVAPPHPIDLSLPITSTYLRRMRAFGAIQAEYQAAAAAAAAAVAADRRSRWSGTDYEPSDSPTDKSDSGEDSSRPEVSAGGSGEKRQGQVAGVSTKLSSGGQLSTSVDGAGEEPADEESEEEEDEEEEVLPSSGRSSATTALPNSTGSSSEASGRSEPMTDTVVDKDTAPSAGAAITVSGVGLTQALPVSAAATLMTTAAAAGLGASATITQNGTVAITAAPSVKDDLAEDDFDDDDDDKTSTAGGGGGVGGGVFTSPELSGGQGAGAENGGDVERMRAFNMFVRLFVDENLDRQVPISRQPKEKIQAIVDSCTRQFPEFASKARKRIQIYLKQCRKTNKRTKDQAGLDKPMHLTSPQSEQVLSRACENEAENAKRMRMGMEPISQPMPAISVTSPIEPSALPTAIAPAAAATNGAILTGAGVAPGGVADKVKIEYKPEQLASLLQAAQQQAAAQAATSVAGTPALTLTSIPSNQPALAAAAAAAAVANGGILPSPAAVASPITSAVTPMTNSVTLAPGVVFSAAASPAGGVILNGNGGSAATVTTTASAGSTAATAAALYRQSLQQVNSANSAAGAGQTNNSSTPSGFTPPAIAVAQPLQNGCSTPPIITDSILNSALVKQKSSPVLCHKLNSTETSAVRQLVTGYRESAAFLLRSADELEHLLQIQPKL